MPVVGLNDYAGDKKKKKDEDEDEKKRNELYTGGNRRGGGGSGLSVIGPENSDDEEELKDVGRMFSRAQQHKDEAPPASAPKRVVTMYKNGFTVDDGPFRSLTDPANLPFLRDVAQGLVPRELEESAAESGAFHLELVDRRGDEWEPPSFVAFGGSGQTLGATLATASPDPVPVQQVVVVQEEEEPIVAVDPSQPQTTVHIRLASGQRLKESLNLSHTVADLQRIVQASSWDRPFRLLAGYPPKPLDPSLSIQDAGVANSAITQKYDA